MPPPTNSQDYALEYGTATVEISEDGIQKGEKCLIVDDLIATGGTIGATVKLVKKLGAEIVECAFLIELPDLKGRDQLGDCDMFAIMDFEGE